MFKAAHYSENSFKCHKAKGEGCCYVEIMEHKTCYVVLLDLPLFCLLTMQVMIWVRFSHLMLSKQFAKQLNDLIIY